MSTDGPQDHDLPETITEPLPCIRCSYELKGLKENGRCPECGTRISMSLRFVNERVMCPSCLAPNHPSAPVCAHCKGPIHGATALADYFRPTPGIHRTSRTTDDDEEEDESTSPMSVSALIIFQIIALFLAFLGVGLIVAVIAEGMSHNQAMASFLIFLSFIIVVGGALSVFGVALSRSTIRRFIRERRLRARGFNPTLKNEPDTLDQTDGKSA